MSYEPWVDLDSGLEVYVDESTWMVHIILPSMVDLSPGKAARFGAVLCEAAAFALKQKVRAARQILGSTQT